MEFKVLSVQQAVIDFNFEEVKAALSETMEKYKGYIVTEDNLSLCKATQKELAGMRIAIEDFRKKQKKELSTPIELMESKCKQLVKLVEDAEAPIKEGIKEFDDKKREEKRVSAMIMIENAVAEYKLNNKYASQLVVLDKYTNLTQKDKDTQTDIITRTLELKSQQDREMEMLEIIKDTIEHANNNINAKLSLEDFKYSISQGRSTREIVAEINERATRIKSSEEKAEADRIAKEQAEAERILKEHKAQIEALQEPQKEVIEQVEQQPTEQPTPPQQANSEAEPLYFVELRFVGTMDVVAKVSNFLQSNNIQYEKLKTGKLGGAK